MSDEIPSRLEAVETPALLVDLDRLDANLDRAADYAARHGLALRPHVKTHKSSYVAVGAAATWRTWADVRDAA